MIYQNIMDWTQTPYTEVISYLSQTFSYINLYSLLNLENYCTVKVLIAYSSMIHSRCKDSSQSRLKKFGRAIDTSKAVRRASFSLMIHLVCADGTVEQCPQSNTILYFRVRGVESILLEYKPSHLSSSKSSSISEVQQDPSRLWCKQCL